MPCQSGISRCSFLTAVQSDRKPWKPALNADLEELRKLHDPRHCDSSGDKRSNHKLQHAANRAVMQEEADFLLPRCFAAAVDFWTPRVNPTTGCCCLNAAIPQEPFHVPGHFDRACSTDKNGLIFDRPHYARVTETEIAHVRAKYAGLVAMCDDYPGWLLGRFDEENLWDDTVLIATAAHGDLLSEDD